MKKISVYTGFDELIQSNPEILDKQDDTDFFFTLPWFSNLAKTASPENYSERIYSLQRTNTSAANYVICPMWAHYSSVFGWPVRRLLSMASFYTSLYRPFATSSPREITQDIPDLIAAMTIAESRWDIIDFHPMDPEHASFNAIRSALSQAGMATQAYFCFGNWYLKVNGRSFENYFDGLPSKLKNTLARKTKQLEKQQQLTIKIIQKETDLGEALSAYEQVYQASWKAAEGFPAFIPGLVTSCAQQGCLRLGIAYINQQAVAAQIWIVHNKTASIYKLAYDERYAQFSIGSILTARVMQHVIDIDQVTEVDYLTGDDAYKQDWMSDRRERWGIMAFNLRTCVGLLAAIRHLAGHFIQSNIRLMRNIFRSGN
ncbi:GNAT family N-acetyltransferase [Undibacterium sp. Jales W-56]|uniref:GNAT family N-acetyltransferase n=1 Tax=Undibacterium sp. Jales W-56 TaxID=2897325 RepID=UPI0021CF6574|nr:GNAT family N-acetyltransferase [Undibacterium sp. Jales W-56]MCU6434108.1 GNAT family N-acetyltransferase [Undibacterium sp. Jales W-56]